MIDNVEKSVESIRNTVKNINSDEELAEIENRLSVIESDKGVPIRFDVSGHEPVPLIIQFDHEKEVLFRGCVLQEAEVRDNVLNHAGERYDLTLELESYKADFL